MSELQVTVRLTIHDGKLSEFKEVAAHLMQSVREKDSGTLQYDWFFNADQTECVVRETYRDSEAVFEHMANAGDDLVTALNAVCDGDLEVFGSPSAALLEATAEAGGRVYSAFLSI